MVSFILQNRVMLGFALLALWAFKSDLASVLTKARSWLGGLSLGGLSFGSGSAPDVDAKDYEALMRLDARAERRQCPECKAAVQAFFAHWLVDNGPTRNSGG